MKEAKRIPDISKGGKLIDLANPQPEVRKNAENAIDWPYHEEAAYLYRTAGLGRIFSNGERDSTGGYADVKGGLLDGLVEVQGVLDGDVPDVVAADAVGAAHVVGRVVGHLHDVAGKGARVERREQVAHRPGDGRVRRAVGVLGKIQDREGFIGVIVVDGQGQGRVDVGRAGGIAGRILGWIAVEADAFQVRVQVRHGGGRPDGGFRGRFLRGLGLGGRGRSGRRLGRRGWPGGGAGQGSCASGGRYGCAERARQDPQEDGQAGQE